LMTSIQYFAPKSTTGRSVCILPAVGGLGGKGRWGGKAWVGRGKIGSVGRRGQERCYPKTLLCA
jgi:hypothetical protein